MKLPAQITLVLGMCSLVVGAMLGALWLIGPEEKAAPWPTWIPSGGSSLSQLEGDTNAVTIWAFNNRMFCDTCTNSYWTTNAQGVAGWSDEVLVAVTNVGGTGTTLEVDTNGFFRINSFPQPQEIFSIQINEEWEHSSYDLEWKSTNGFDPDLR